MRHGILGWRQVFSLVERNPQAGSENEQDREIGQKSLHRGVRAEWCVTQHCHVEPTLGRPRFRPLREGGGTATTRYAGADPSGDRRRQRSRTAPRRGLRQFWSWLTFDIGKAMNRAPRILFLAGL